MIGISKQGLRYRLEDGWSIEDLLSSRDQGKRRDDFNPDREQPLTINGAEKTMGEWAEEIGISVRALKARINKFGWTGDELLQTSGSKKRKI